MMAIPSRAGGLSGCLWWRFAARAGRAGPRSATVIMPTATLLVATVSILMRNSRFGDGYSGSGPEGHWPGAYNKLYLSKNMEAGHGDA